MSVVSTVTRFAGRTALQVQKHAPTILTVAGIAGGVTAAVLGAKAALKSEPVLKQLQVDRQDVNMVSEMHDISNEDRVKALTYVYVKNGKDLFVLYAPALAVGGLSIAAILWGHGILRARNAAITAAYVSLERSFAAYRERVRKDGGVERDTMYANGLDYEVNEETKEPELTVDTKAAHLYTRLFDETNPNWSKEMDYNLHFLTIQQRIWNDKLCSSRGRRGHVFLNEVLQSLGFDHTPEGAIAGWLFDGDGDGYIDFGLDKMNSHDEVFKRTLDGVITLEFNVDGVIFDKI